MPTTVFLSAWAVSARNRAESAEALNQRFEKVGFKQNISWLSFFRLPRSHVPTRVARTQSDRAVAAIRRKPWSLRLDGLRLTAILGPYYGVKRLSRHILRARLDGAYSVFHDRLTPPATEHWQRYTMLRSVLPGRASAVVGCAENQKLPKINARVTRNQAGVGGIAMQLPNQHRVPAILLSSHQKPTRSLLSSTINRYRLQDGSGSTRQVSI